MIQTIRSYSTFKRGKPIFLIQNNMMDKFKKAWQYFMNKFKKNHKNKNFTENNTYSEKPISESVQDKFYVSERIVSKLS